MNRIPKKLHMYWDKSPMSRLQVFTIETFHKLNPDWQIFVYTPIQSYTRKAHYIPDYTGKDYFYLIESMYYVKMIEVDINTYNIEIDLHNILRSDVFRYHILYNEGGAWSDFDVIWLKPMSHMNEINYVGEVTMLDMGATIHFYNTTHGHHGIGILLATPAHIFYKTLIDKSVEVMRRGVVSPGHQAFGSAMWGELYKTLQSVIVDHPDMVGIPYETFAPYGIYDLDKLYNKTDLSVINNNVLGIHWFNGHVLGKKYVNENLFSRKFKCSLTTVLETNGYTDV